MSIGLYQIFSPLNSYPELITKQYQLQTAGNILPHLTSKQTIQIQLSDEFIKSICNPIQLDIFNDKIQLDQDQIDSRISYDAIQYFGSSNKFKINTTFLWHYKKEKFKKYYITIYSIQKATIIPDIIKQCNKHPILNYNLNVNIPHKIKYSMFTETFYSILDPAQTGLSAPIYTLAINIPYKYYNKAMIIDEQQFCYDINNKDFWFTASNMKEYQELLTDIATNGIYKPVGLRINPDGQIISSQDARTRTLIALQLKLPYIPALVYLTSYNSQDLKEIPYQDFKKQANQLFNPYFLFQ